MSQGDVILPRGVPGVDPGVKQSNGVWGLGMPQIPQVGPLLGGLRSWPCQGFVLGEFLVIFRCVVLGWFGLGLE